MGRRISSVSPRRGTVSIIDETIDLRTVRNALLQSFLRTGRSWVLPIESQNGPLIKGSSLTPNSKGSGRSNQSASLETALPARYLHALSGEKSRPFRVAFIGHPYNLFDPDMNKDVLTLAKQLGIEILTPDHLSEKEIEREVSDLSKEIYWSSGREIVGALFHFLKGGVDGVVFLTSFKCGIDALLQEFIKRSLKIRKEIHHSLSCSLL